MNVFQALTCFILSTCTYETSNGPSQVHLALGETENQMIVSWADSGIRNASEVRWGLSPSDLDQHTGGNSREFSNFGREIFSYWAIMTDLEPSTKYYYQIVADNIKTRVFSFKTFPADCEWQPKICLFGDLGLKNGVSIADLNNGSVEGQWDMAIHVGDIAYDLYSDRGHVGDQFLQAIEPMASSMPYMVAPGNHEYMPVWGDSGNNYKNRFKMPSGNNDNYVFKVGPIRFIVISTENYYYLEGGSPERVEAQRIWLEKVLSEANDKQNRKICPWIIVLGHRPLYCTGKQFGRCPNWSTWLRIGSKYMGKGLEDIFYRYGVDVYFCGHNHHYERTLPVYRYTTGSLDNPYMNPNMTVYVVTGAAGNREGLDGFKEDPPVWSGFRAHEYSYTKLTANRTHLHFEQISTVNATMIDSFTIVQHNHRMFGENS